ncbi:phenylalanine--tRNA ligase subunit beta [Ktedonobacter racemifer]|uniref:Phenylalanine--tRNA ligase beta subunit n=1 Tax=Ktedonobacter racemifer DSM 44963 TaxID=485913 RepID=D6TN97_KTERA|nr:phenylalanine--tRNA ligase subunit beta [Ktedonobacter racemifer]EFH87247.1 phenylalanyl-tRNA synthetase, beta subunit [Ktedonobacter racemifer DSM 44963]
MRVPLSWLKDYVDITMSPEELAHTLTMAGLEVETIDYIGKEWGDKIITAQIIHLEKVETSDHLNYTRVNTGTQELNVICGAPNIKLGDKVPLALAGAQVGDLEIRETKKMGYVSQGMLCSPRELGMGNDHNGIYILDEDTPLGLKLSDLLGEVVLEFSIKAHRGDLSSIIGIAREVAALTNQPLRMPQPHFAEQGTPASDLVRITVEDEKRCPRYSARIISNVKLGPSPSWMGRRLLAAGMRPISNVVDITNYVMLELGQPLHAFDYDLVPEHHIIVRRAQEGEKLKTLDDVERKLTSEMLLITDPQGPTAIAGVMGGAKSEVNDATQTILLESANFLGSSVRRTSTKLGLRTDASSRFEKGIDPSLTTLGANRACQLLVELASATINPGIADQYPVPVEPRTLRFSLADIEWLTSMKVTHSEVETTLSALGFGVQFDEQGDGMRVSVPTHRNDIEESADLVEEVIRLIGYNKIPSTIPIGPLPERLEDTWFAREQELRTLLVNANLNETITYSLTSRARMAKLLSNADEESVRYLLQAPRATNGAGEQAPVKSNGTQAVATFDPHSIPAVVLANSLSSDMECMRLTLMSSLLETVQENSKRNKAGLRFFEIGRRYLPGASASQQPDERRAVGIALSGPAEITWIPELARPADFYDLKGTIETLLAGLKIGRYRFTPTQHPTFHPGRCALLELPRQTADGRTEVFSPVGVLGEVHPLVQQHYDLPQRAYLCEIDLEQLYNAVPARITYAPISRHQELTRDLALIVDEQVPAQHMQDAIQRLGGELLRAVTLFDLYTGDPIPAGKKNLTYTLVYQSQERTLKDTEANEAQERIIRGLHEEFGADLRQ